MRFGQNTLQATLTVCITLVVAFVVTGFASSAYHREQRALGQMHFGRGQAMQAGGKLDPALEEYRQALIFAPDNTEYRLSLATALLDTGRLDEAQSHLEELEQENPTSGRINLLLGRLAVQQHNLRQAVGYYQRGVYEYWPASELPMRRQARWELANLLNETGDRNGFLGELMQLYTNLPPDATTERLKIGYLLQSSGATSEAMRIFQDVVKRSPENGEARRGLGEADFSSGQYVTARHEFQRALRLNPKDQTSAQELALTNEVIDVDPAMPYISGAEQVRRSRNLLNRVIKNLEGCNPAGSAAPTPSPASVVPAPGDAYQQRMLNAKDLLAGTSKEDDPALTMQKTAAQLWADKAHYCTLVMPQDHTLDMLFARIGHE